MTRRAFLILLAGAIGLFFAASPPSAARAIDTGRSSAFIEKLGNDAVDLVADEALSQEEKARQFRLLLQDGFALTPIARFVLGKYWRQANDEQRRRYVELFEEYVVRSYSSRFGEYKGETLRVVEEQAEGQDGAVVTTMIRRPKGEAVRVQWYVREHKSQLKIVDVVIEGVSMSLTQRSEFAAVIRSNGGNIDAFLDSLERMVSTN